MSVFTEGVCVAIWRKVRVDSDIGDSVVPMQAVLADFFLFSLHPRNLSLLHTHALRSARNLNIHNFSSYF